MGKKKLRKRLFTGNSPNKGLFFLLGGLYRTDIVCSFALRKNS